MAVAMLMIMMMILVMVRLPLLAAAGGHEQRLRPSTYLQFVFA